MKYYLLKALSLLLLLGQFLNSNGQISANFEADTLRGCDILAGVKFTDLSTGGITKWEWDFGNGSSAVLQNPTASYTQSGSFDVRLIVSDGTVSDTLERVAYIKVSKSPTVNYSVDTTKGCTPLTINFQDSSIAGSNPIQERIWDFGDGGPSTNNSTISHTYLNKGNFSTALVVKDTEGCSSLKNGASISVIEGPIADFTARASTRTCTFPLVVDFANLTANHSSNVVYKWDFGDGTTSAQRNPTKTYSSQGTYDVKLVASSGSCTDSITIVGFVEIEETKASFALVKDSLCYKIKRYLDEDNNPYSDTITDVLGITNLSIGADEFDWDFGDGTTSTQENPIHFYKDTGRYVVKLTVSSGTICIDDTSINIYVQSVHPMFSLTPKHRCVVPLPISYRDSSINADKWSWHFQTDTGTVVKNVQNPVHIQTTNGLFADSLIISSSVGCKDTLVKRYSRDTRLPVLRVETDTSFGRATGCVPLQVRHLYGTDWKGGSFPPLRGAVATSWLWDFGNGTTSTDSFPGAQTYPDDSTYTIKLTVIDTSGCEISSFQVVSAGKPSNPRIGILEDTLCVYDRIEMIEASGNPRISTLEWLYSENPKDPNPIFETYNRKNSISIPVEEFIEEVERDSVFGSYGFGLVARAGGCPDTTWLETDIVINGPQAKPAFKIDSCGGYKVNFFTRASEDADEFLWDFGDGTSSDSINPTHVFSTNGAYIQKYYIGNSETGCTIIDSFSLGIAPIQKGIIAKDTMGCVPFLVNLTGADNKFVGYKWYLKGNKIGTTKNLQYVLNTGGTYKFMLVFGNGFGCKDTSYQTIIANGPTAAMEIKALNECLPYQVSFTDKSIYSSGVGPLEWDFGNGSIGNRQIDTAGYSPRDSLFSVSLFVADTNGCRDTLTYVDTIRTPNIIVDFRAVDNRLCLGEEVDLINQSFGINQSFTWEYGDGATSTLENPLLHVYQKEDEFEVSLKMEDGTGCEITTTKVISVQDKPIVGFTADVLSASCFPLLVNFTDTSQSDFLAEWEWDFGGQGKSFFENPIKNFNERGAFDVSLIASTSNGCSDSLTKVAYIKINGPEASFTISKDTVCKFEDVTFTLTNPTEVDNFIWDFGDGNTSSVSPVTYQYKRRAGKIRPVLSVFSDPARTCGKFIIDSIYVEDVIASFTVEDDTAGCEPHQVKLVNTSQRADSWGWDFGDGRQSTNYNDSITYLTEGDYLITMNILNNNGCVDTAYQKIIVNPIPKIIKSADTTICEGDATLLIASGGDNYSWRPINGLLTPNSNQTVANPIESTTYRLEVSSNEGCVDSAIVQLDVQTKPENYTLISDTNLIIGEELQLDVNTGPSYLYNWTPKRWMSCYDCATPIAQPLESIIYYVDITDPFNCFPQRDSIEINLTVDFSVDVPMAFSPNGDGVNDRIYVRGWGIKELLDFKIYNRFGEIVYESNRLEEGWDGKYRGQVQNIETYIYSVSVLTYQDKVLTKKGNISLMR